MSQETWNAVDTYFIDQLLTADPILDAAQARCDENGLPAIQVSATQGKLLHLLTKMHGAKRILEIGTLGGYSTIWLASALPEGGKLVTLEYEPLHARVAEENIKAAGLADRVEIAVGAALDTLPSLQGGDPFDFVFIDADKPNKLGYVQWALKLSRPGTVIIVDNVVRNGEVCKADSEDEAVRGTRNLMSYLAEEPRLDATAIQTVGSKGYDGFLLARCL